MSRRYQKIQELLPEIEEMLSEGKSQREVAKYFGLESKLQIHELLKRERRKQRKLAYGILPKPKGRPRKTAISSEEAKDNEIKRLRMENELLRDFLHLAGRK